MAVAVGGGDAPCGSGNPSVEVNEPGERLAAITVGAQATCDLPGPDGLTDTALDLQFAGRHR